MPIYRFIPAFLSALIALLIWLFIISLASGLGDIYVKLFISEQHQLPPVSIEILTPSILFFIALLFEHLPCLRTYARPGWKNSYAIAKWAWVTGMVVNSILVVVIVNREQLNQILILTDFTSVDFDEAFTMAAALSLMLPAAVIRFCAAIQCCFHNSEAYGT